MEIASILNVKWNSSLYLKLLDILLLLLFYLVFPVKYFSKYSKLKRNPHYSLLFWNNSHFNSHYLIRNNTIGQLCRNDRPWHFLFQLTSLAYQNLHNNFIIQPEDITTRVYFITKYFCNISSRVFSCIYISKHPQSFSSSAISLEKVS